MRKSARSWKERICALLLAAAMVITWMMPNAALTAEAAPGDESAQTVDVTFKVQDDSNNLLNSDVVITILEKGEQVVEIKDAEQNNTFVVPNLKIGTTYTYTVTKTGYEYKDASEKREFTPQESSSTQPNVNEVTVTMRMSDIKVSSTSVQMNVRDTQQIKIENAISGAEYTWTSDKPEVVAVNDGVLEAKRNGSAAVTVSYGAKNTTINVTVSKITPDLKLTATPNTGNDTASVTLEVTGLEQYTGKNAATGTFDIYVNGNCIKQNVNVSETEYIYDDSDAIMGSLTFKVVYSGDDRYESVTAIADPASYTKTKKLEFVDSDAKNVIRDDAENKEFTIEIDSDSKGNRSIGFTSDNEAVATVDAITGIVTVHKAGQATITVTAQANENYSADSQTYTVVVQRVIDVKNRQQNNTLSWDEYTKIYNKNAEVELTLPLTGDDAVSGATNIKAVFSAIAKSDDEDALNAGQDYAAMLQNGDIKITGTVNGVDNSDLSELYVFENHAGVVVPSSVNIEPRPVYLGTKDVQLEYGQDLSEQVASTDGLIYILDAAEDSGVMEGDNVDISNIKAYLDASVDSTTVEYIKYPDVVLPYVPLDGEVLDDNSNYKIFPAHADDQYSKDYYGDLTVNEETLDLDKVFNAVDINSGENTGVYLNGQTIYVRGFNEKKFVNANDSSAELQITLKDKTYYQNVKLEIEGQTSDYTLSDSVIFGGESRVITGNIYFTRTDGLESEKVEGFQVIIDSDSPEVTFGDWEESTSVVADWVDAVTFGHYTKESSYTLSNVTKKDLPENNITEEQLASGAEDVEWSYYILKKESDQQEITADDIKALKDKDGWTSMSGTADDIPVVKAPSDELETVAEYYVVVVQVSDKVGNAAMYSSNGLVVDFQYPTIIITDANGQSFPENTFYNSDVLYKVNITDYEVQENTDESVTSGIKSYDLVVEKDGDRTYPEDEADITNQVSEENVTYSIKDLQGLKREFENTVIASENNSNDVKIKVKAVDQAGKEKEVIQSLMIDTTDPVINVSYVNNDVHNGKYFNAGRTMKITFTERNFDRNKVEFEFMKTEDPTEEYDSNSTLVPVDELQNYGIKATWDPEGKDKEYTEKNQVTEYKDDRQIELLLEFPAEDDTEFYYHIVPYCTDEAGNSNVVDGKPQVTYEPGTEAKTDFAIDTKDPVISVEYTTGGSTFSPKSEILPDGQKSYSKETVKAIVTINEKNFWNEDETGKSFAADQFDFKGTQGVDSKGKIIDSVKAEDYKAVADNASDTNWGRNGYARTNSNFVFETDANYTFTFTYTDLAGNPATYDSAYFTVDKPETDSPEGAISLDKEGSIWSTVWQAITFNIFRNTSYEVTLDSEDGISGVASIEYYKTPDPISQNADMAGLNWSNLGISGAKAERRGNFSVSPDEQFVVYEKITDYAGNVTYIYPTNGAIADATKPNITITEANRNAASNGIYNEDVRLHISVEDPVNGGTYSGIERIWYDVHSTGNVTNSLERELADNSANRVQGHRTWSGDITIDAEQFNSNDVKVQVHAVDFSGNQYDSEVTELKIDVTEPTIDVTYDLNSPLNERYYNATRTATVTVTERNFDPSAVRFNITNTDGTQPSISGWSNSSNSGVSDSATHTCTVTFAADGDYTFTLNTTDLAGNVSNYTRVDDFTIDQTDPTIQVSYDNNNDAEPGYFNADRTATITVTEHNFNAAEVNTAITASLEGRGVSTPGLGGWSTRGDVHTASVTFSADADYTFDVDYTDLAGNAAADYEQDSFTVDQTAPELEFFDIEDKSANNDVVAPGVRYSDNNYTENGVEITLESANHGEMALDGDRSSIPNGESIKMADFERTKENDDLYTMTAVITDLAGNETEDSVIFSVNRFGSVFVLSDETQELVDNYYTNEEQDLVVTEINVDSLVFNGISYGRDGELVDLEAGTDYEVKASGSEVSWKQYDYTINKENFEKEGNYTVTIDSEDRATNVGNSRAKGCDIEFAIDKTAPTVVITGIENDAQYRANTRNITVNAADNIAMGDVGVYVGNNDEPAQTFDAKDIQAAGGELTYTMNSSNSRQDIKAVATDAAGNTAEAEITRVLLTSNLFVQFYSNTPLLVGTIVGVVVIAGGLLWFFLIFKRKKDEEQANK